MSTSLYVCVHISCLYECLHISWDSVTLILKVFQTQHWFVVVLHTKSMERLEWVQFDTIFLRCWLFKSKLSARIEHLHRLLSEHTLRVPLMY